MTKQLGTLNTAAANAPVNYPVTFVELRFDSGTLYLSTALQTIEWGGKTWTGSGAIGEIGQIDEDTIIGKNPLPMTLRGLPADIIAIVLQESFQGRRGIVYQGFLSPTTGQLLETPVELFRGRMDTASISQGEQISVSVNLESRFAAWDKPNVRRYNNADQQSRYPGDKGLEFVEQTTDRQINWGVSGR